jgi:hypothetical protein
VYVQALAGQVASKLQGERVETPEWIIKNKLKPDAEYYIDHQLYNPLAQLFGIMVEKMPGFVRPAVWAEGEKMVGQREAIAGRLLFDEGLSACRNSAKKEFMKLFGPMAGSPMGKGSVASAATASPPTTPVFRKPPVDETMAKAEAEAFGSGSKPAFVPLAKKQQTILSAFAIDTACFMDERLVKEMRAARKTRTSAKAEAKAQAEEIPPAPVPVAASASASAEQKQQQQQPKKKAVKGKKDTT